MPVVPHRTPAYVRERGRPDRIETQGTQGIEECRGYTGALLAKGRFPKRLCVAGHILFSYSSEERQMRRTLGNIWSWEITESTYVPAATFGLQRYSVHAQLSSR